MPFELLISATIYPPEYPGVPVKQRDIRLLCAQGEQAFVFAESFEVCAMVEKASEEGVVLELIALHPGSSVYDGTLLRLNRDESASFTFENLIEHRGIELIHVNAVVARQE